MRRSGNAEAHSRQGETEYLDALVRGVYSKPDLPEGHCLKDEDVYLAIPLQKGQISCRELMRGEMLLHREQEEAPYQDRRYREPLFADSFSSEDDLPARTGRRKRIRGSSDLGCSKIKD